MRPKILLTGATGYIGQRLLPVLIEKGYHVVCCVRESRRFNPSENLSPHIATIEFDLLKEETFRNIPKNIEGGFYLVHSMAASKEYMDLEKQSAINFRELMNTTNVKQIIYLGGITNEEKLSQHLASRKQVEEELSKGRFELTTLRAGIIIGSGSASFEIIRDLVEKLPVMITPKWLNTKCQPIGIADVISFLSNSLMNEVTYGETYDIGGPDILSYKEMLLGYAKVRKLKRKIFIVPIMTPRLSSYWLYFVTSTSYKLATALVNSMKIEVVCKDRRINSVLGIEPISYEAALVRTFEKIERNQILSSWKDAFASGQLNMRVSDFIDVPKYGCFKDIRVKHIEDVEKCKMKIWRLGGETGWYYGNWLWKFRGLLDKLVGGVGLRRGRTHNDKLEVGDAIDFWRVLYASKIEGRLLLFAEMKLPGEAWLEFKIKGNDLIQTATFRPKGLKGRLYWYSVLPFHGFIFKGMIRKLVE